MKTLVLDSVSSPITKRVYNMALEEFFQWYAKEPRPAFTKATVSAWRVTLEERGLGSSSERVGHATTGHHTSLGSARSKKRQRLYAVKDGERIRFRFYWRS